jgi:hypothetical protein
MIRGLLGRRLHVDDLPPDVEVRRAAWLPDLARWFLGTGSAAAAVTIGRVIVVHPTTRLTPRLLRHELAHVRQWRNNPLVFPLSYAWHHFRHGYRQNPYEIEARAAEPGPERRSI